MYILVRILVLMMMAVPVSLFFGDKISVGELCVLIALSLILIELCDIKELIRRKNPE